MRQSPTLLLALAGVTLGSSLYARQANRNDLQGAGATNCAKNIVIFARGTTEQGNVGNIAGPPFFDALGQQVGAGNLAVQGVDYPASIAGFLAGGDADGSKAMANLTQKAITACPNSKVIMSGYSQGAQLVHNGAGQLPANITSKVAGVIMFGDPSEFLFSLGMRRTRLLTRSCT